MIRHGTGLAVYANPVPVVCVRLSEEALAALDAQAARKGLHRSAWLRDTVQRSLGLPRGGDAVEALDPRPPASIEPLVPGDRLMVLEPTDGPRP